MSSLKKKYRKIREIYIKCEFLFIIELIKFDLIQGSLERIIRI